MRVLLLGAGGMLARDLAAQAPPEVALTCADRAALDVTDAAALTRTIRDLDPAVVINAAAYSRVDDAERSPDAAFAVNGAAPGAIGQAATAVGATVVHFSTDYVFDGKADAPYAEDARPNPLSVYGASKLEGERSLTASGVDHLIIRTQWLFGATGRSFPRTMWQRAGARQPTRVVRDQLGHPTSTEDLARATWVLVRQGVRGLLHVANAGIASWYDVAQRVFAAAGAAHLLTPCSTAEFPTPARRPARAVLETARAQALLGGPLPAWEDALDRLLERLGAE
jgi:dTDP-4-dehydrorhamnose reductase